MKRFISAAILLLFAAPAMAGQLNKVQIPLEYRDKIELLLSKMTIEEKIGQLNQYAGDTQATGVPTPDTTVVEQVEEGLVGSMINIRGAQYTRAYQEHALKSRLGIPLLFGLDVVHGLQTIYPIPLGEAASFDLDLMRRTAAGAAQESSAIGIHWTFAPMVDIARDARWGRITEGAGEDTWYASHVARARVMGFQGSSLADEKTIMACAKHFVGYGGCIAGKDYNSVDMSLLTLHEVYLPPFKAALDANVGSFMNSFNELNGVPATADTYIQRDILKGAWAFQGLMVSDWGSIKQMISQGNVADLKGAALAAILGGCDMDMESRAYRKHLKELVETGVVDIAYVDDAVRRVLLKKYELGLFDDPFRYCDVQREKSDLLTPALRVLALEAAQKSIVLLKNNNQTLPVAAKPRNIVVVGPLADSQTDMCGAWAFQGVRSEVVTLLKGLKDKFNDSNVNYVRGYDRNSNELMLSDDDRKIISAADLVIVTIGETANESGESRSKADINVHPNQQQLVKQIKQGGAKVVTVLMSGRPMIFTQAEQYSDAILCTWWLGTEAGNAIANVLKGDYNPSGKLPVTFPAHIGQMPIYYNYNNTGHPAARKQNYTTGYIDIDYDPAYFFGYGLSYTTFDISKPTTDKSTYSMNDIVKVSVNVKNTGLYGGTETVQLYIRDMVSSVVRPIKELRGFKQVSLKPNQEQQIVFEMAARDFGFFNSSLNFVTEPGDFLVMVGANSRDLESVKICFK